MIYFVTYGDERFEASKRRIVDQATRTGQFDRIIAYGRADLTGRIVESPLFGQRRGGGYWVWKPYIVHKTLDMMHDGDLLVYVDCGCSVFASREWTTYFGLLKKHDAVTFLLSTTNEQYTRRNVLDHYAATNRCLGKQYQVSSTFFLLKKTPNTVKLVSEWQEMMLGWPNMVLDVPTTEIRAERRQFIEHRHDQSLFSALVYRYRTVYNLVLRLNRFEGGIDPFRSQAVLATRLADDSNRGITKRSVVKTVLLYICVNPYRSVYHRFWTVAEAVRSPRRDRRLQITQS